MRTMDSNIVKLPSEVSRRLHSRKPRRSKNGTPEERAAKRAAETTTAATVTEIYGGDNLAKAAKAAPTFTEFAQALRTYFVQEFARGRNVDQIFDDLEDCYRRADKALEKRKP